MANGKLWRFEVWHPEYGTAVVESIGPDSATAAAAKTWGAPWREIAGYCRVTKLGTAKRPRCRNCFREFGEPGFTAAYCPECERAMELRRREMRYVRSGDRRARMREAEE